MNSVKAELIEKSPSRAVSDVEDERASAVAATAIPVPASILSD
jgi:hypothetical protein